MNSALIFRNIGRFVLLMSLQLLVFNNIYLGGYINPCIYILFIAMLPTNTGKIPTMIIAFFMGLMVDISVNMLGFHAFAATFAAFLRGQWLDKIILRDNVETVDTPSIRSVPYQAFSLYLLLIMFIFFVVYYSLLYFNLRDVLSVLVASVLSTAVSWLLAILYQTLLIRKVES